MAGGIIVLGGAWLLVTGLLARSQLDDIRAEIGTLRTQISSGDLAAARSTSQAIAMHAHRASEFTSGPAWSIAAHVPAGGAPFRVVRDITAQSDVLGRSVLPTVITATHQLDPSSLRAPDGTIDLARIAAIAPKLNHADAAMTAATSSITRSPGTTWLGFVDSARSEYLDDLTSLGKTLHSADLAARIVPPMLGEHGTKRYFVAFENDAEARGTGGQPGAFAILRVTDGRVSFERFESDGALNGVAAQVRFGKNYDAIWHPRGPYDTYIDSNVSAHFPYAARIWLSMWQVKSGEKLDGALAVDPQALSYLLAVTGPATLPDGSAVTAQNVVALTQKDLYAKFGAKANNERKQYLLDIARAVSEQIVDAHADSTALVQAAGTAGAQKRILVYSADPAVEADLQQTSLSGAVPRTHQPYAGLVIDDATANKLDYYLRRSMTYTRSGCGSTRQVTVTVHLTNTAPAGLPPYVTGATVPDNVARPGEARDSVFYYATHGAIISSFELDGRKQPFFAGFERGHPVFGLDVLIPRGTTRTVTIRLTEPAGTNPPLVLRQPLVQPLHLTVHDQTCG
ncbi:DUF4012 domain-containing protein [Jatrophihabitans endophyticus]|uniref:DUF4012 domain-containing protein n=1 Tax=Jatrophihabitans endophyticus TaxID=1206085 RepID=UPI0026F34CFC|nr:DUF4012 domain-containing protein [Jatrophihabitans endophyticus]